MHKIAFIALFSLPLFAGFFPKSVHTSIQSIQQQTATLNTPFPLNGMSGIVIHDYNSASRAITSRIVQTDTKGGVSLLPTDILHHDKLPTIKTAVQKNDKVIGGYLYDTVLVLAPNEKTYTNVIHTYHKKWIHPDLYALFLSTHGERQPTKANLLQFAKAYQVGLIYIVRKNEAVLLDPISGKIVGKKSATTSSQAAQFPFYMHFDKLDSGWFGNDAKGDYYSSMGAL